jgi:hypothetical protein
MHADLTSRPTGTQHSLHGLPRSPTCEEGWGIVDVRCKSGTGWEVEPRSSVCVFDASVRSVGRVDRWIKGR